MESTSSNDDSTSSVEDSTLCDEDLKNLKKIKKRWSCYEDTGVFCKECMYEAIRHWDRNMDPACYTYDKSIHPDRYDGEIIAHSANDIWCLIDIIKKITNKKVQTEEEPKVGVSLTFTRSPESSTEDITNYLKSTFKTEQINISYVCDVCQKNHKTLDDMHTITCPICNKCCDYCKSHESVIQCPFC